MKRAIRLHPTDNVAVCTQAVLQGEDVVYGGDSAVRAVSDISFCNKIALAPIAQGELVKKYGETIGKATRAIAVGELVNHENIVGIARAYRDEYIKE